MRIMPGHRGPIMKMWETPDGSGLVTIADDNNPFLWSLSGAAQDPTSLAGNEDLVLDIAINSVGDRLLAGGYDPNARIWDLKAGDVATSALELPGHESDIEAVVWHPSKPIAVTASKDLNLGVWEIGPADEDNPNGTINKQQLIPIEESLTALATDSQGKWLAARTVGSNLGDPKEDVLVYSWDELIKVDGSPPPIRLDEPFAKMIAFTKGEGEPLLIVGDSDGSISLYKIEPGNATRVTRKLGAHSTDVEAICVVEVDQRNVIVTGSSDGSVHWWKYGGTEHSQSRTFGAAAIACVDASPDGRWVAAGSNDGSVWLWDTNEKNAQKGAIQLVTGASSVDSVLIDVKSRWLIAGCSDGVIRMWDLTFAKLLTLASLSNPDDKIELEMKTIDSRKSLSMR
jgi:WD40 repeat protein